jgi:uncharacterized protein (DUF1330 family)
MRGFGFHGDGRMGHGGLMAASTYVLITVSSVTDANVLKKAVQDLAAAVTTFSGHLAVDSEKPVSWGGAAFKRVIVIQFPDVEQAQAWKNSDAFKGFDSDLHRSSASTIELVQGLPMPMGRGGRRFDAKAFAPNVKDYDRLLDQQLKSICKGC